MVDYVKMVGGRVSQDPFVPQEVNHYSKKELRLCSDLLVAAEQRTVLIIAWIF